MIPATRHLARHMSLLVAATGPEKIVPPVAKKNASETVMPDVGTGTGTVVIETETVIDTAKESESETATATAIVIAIETTVSETGNDPVAIERPPRPTATTPRATIRDAQSEAEKTTAKSPPHHPNKPPTNKHQKKTPIPSSARLVTANDSSKSNNAAKPYTPKITLIPTPLPPPPTTTTIETETATATATATTSPVGDEIVDRIDRLDSG